jgi:hypothetical protein
MNTMTHACDEPIRTRLVQLPVADTAQIEKFPALASAKSARLLCAAMLCHRSDVGKFLVAERYTNEYGEEVTSHFVTPKGYRFPAHGLAWLHESFVLFNSKAHAQHFVHDCDVRPGVAYHQVFRLTYEGHDLELVEVWSTRPHA